MCGCINVYSVVGLCKSVKCVYIVCCIYSCSGGHVVYFRQVDILAAGRNISRRLQIMLWLFHLFSTARMLQYLIKFDTIIKRVRFLLYIDASARSVGVGSQSIDGDSVMCR